MATIETLSSTTFSGRRFTRKQLVEVQETVETFKNLSRQELALTLCEHLNWKNPAGKLKIHSCFALLDKLEAEGIVTLPAKKKQKAYPLEADWQHILTNYHQKRRGVGVRPVLLMKDDVVAYDRGYFSYPMLYQHLKSQIHAVFRLQESSYNVIRDFFSNEQTDIIADIYHARWGVEELYKVSKRIFEIEDFHAKSERGIKQEIFAHFALITMNRIFANQADIDLNQPTDSIFQSDALTRSGQPPGNHKMSKIKTNFKNCIHVFTRGIEELLLLQNKMKAAVERTFNFIIGRHQKERPGRSYPRISMRPSTKFKPTKKKTKKNLKTLPTTAPAL